MTWCMFGQMAGCAGAGVLAEAYYIFSGRVGCQLSAPKNAYDSREAVDAPEKNIGCEKQLCTSERMPVISAQCRGFISLFSVAGACITVFSWPRGLFCVRKRTLGWD